MEIFLDTDIKKILEVGEAPQVKNVPYWSSEIYGFGKYIRQYGFYPKQLPLLIFTDHSGPHVINRLNDFEINTTSPVVMFHSPELVRTWKSSYEKPCYNLYSPFVFYRKKKKIRVSNNAKGTIAYPAHTIPELELVGNIERYIQQLKSLPEKYQPVSVSLHYHDLNKGLHKIFLNHGFPVYTAGNPLDYRFTERFYTILRNFRYATSNIPGSYLFYAVEMNIPFFLWGEEPSYERNSDSHLAVQALESANTKDEMLSRFVKMFDGLTDEISSEQKSLVESALGLHDGVSRLKMCQILYGCYSKFFIQSIIAKGRTFLIARLRPSKGR